MSADDEALRAVEGWARRRLGLRFDADWQPTLHRRLEGLVARSGLRSVTDLLLELEADEATWGSRLAAALAVHHTAFFRERPILARLQGEILPELVERHGEHRIWCAAVSTGEEAYTVAMLLAEALGLQEARRRFSILGTDLVGDVIQRAEVARYPAEAVRGLDPERRRRWLVPLDDGDHEVRPDLRQLCTFRRLNLATGSWPFRHRFSVVLCRNVLYYFSRETQRDLVRRLFEVVAPGGYLLTGVSESLRELDHPWTTVAAGIHRRPPESPTPRRAPHVDARDDARGVARFASGPGRGASARGAAPSGSESSSVRPAAHRAASVPGSEPAADDGLKPRSPSTAGGQAGRAGAQAGLPPSRPFVVFGASTGGVEALRVIVPALPVSFPGGVAVIHIADDQVQPLARSLDEAGDLSVSVARPGERVKAGTLLLAPGRKEHLLIDRWGAELKTRAQPGGEGELHVPSVDALFSTAAAAGLSSTIGVLLTGMGTDGAMGLKDIRDRGGSTIVQDEKTSVVFGMPGAALALGAVEEATPLPRIAEAVMQACEAVRSRRRPPPRRRGA